MAAIFAGDDGEQVAKHICTGVQSFAVQVAIILGSVGVALVGRYAALDAVAALVFGRGNSTAQQALPLIQRETLAGWRGINAGEYARLCGARRVGSNKHSRAGCPRGGHFPSGLRHLRFKAMHGGMLIVTALSNLHLHTQRTTHGAVHMPVNLFVPGPSAGRVVHPFGHCIHAGRVGKGVRNILKWLITHGRQSVCHIGRAASARHGSFQHGNTSRKGFTTRRALAVYH